MKKLLILISAIMLYACSTNQISSSNDVTGPYINLTQYEFVTVVGKPIDFSNISAYDDVDGLMDVSVKGYVNYDEAGEYYPILYSIDTSGNETDVAVTVYVKDSEYVELEEAQENILVDEETIEKENCTKEGTNTDYPCDVVINEEIQDYKELFDGESGKERCEAKATEDESCEIVYTNDHSFWGYGLKKTEESN